MNTVTVPRFVVMTGRTKASNTARHYGYNYRDVAVIETDGAGVPKMISESREAPRARRAALGVLLRGQGRAQCIPHCAGRGRGHGRAAERRTHRIVWGYAGARSVTHSH